MRSLLWFPLTVVPLFAQAPEHLTLAQAEATAARNNPDISVALLNAAAANQVTIEARSAFLPNVIGSVTGVGALANSRIAAGALNNPVIYNRLAGGVTVNQLISDFGRTSNLTASARFRAEARADAAKAARADVLLQVDRAYFSALRARSLLTVAEETVKARQLVVDQVTALANAKLKSGLDLTFAQVNLSDAKLLLLNAQNNERAAYADLSNAMGFREWRTFELSEEGLASTPPSGADEFVQQSLRQRPELLSARLDLEGARKFTEAERELRNPTVSGLAAAGGIPVRDDVLQSRYVAAGLNVNIPIFNGHLFTARGNEAEYRAQAAEQNLRSLENRIVRDVQVAFLNTSTAYQRLTTTQELLGQATQALDLAQSRYNLGLGSIIELSQAQLNVTSAQIGNTDAKFDFALQQAVLAYQSGAAR